MFYRKVLGGYRLNSDQSYYSKRYGKTASVIADFFSDGATGAKDIFSLSWWIHDRLCATGCWDDGTRVSNLQASMVLADILWSEGRYFRAFYWFIATFLLGGGMARKNGLWRVDEVDEVDDAGDPGEVEE